MGPFDEILKEINESTDPTSFLGRIGVNIMTEIISELVPKYYLNSATMRFVPLDPALVGGGSAPPRRSMARRPLVCTKMCIDMSSSFVGWQHVSAIVRLRSATRPYPYSFSRFSLMSRGRSYQISRSAVRGESAPALVSAPTKLPKYQYREGGCYAFLRPSFNRFSATKISSLSCFKRLEK